jgi:putative SOS response-associated peptidase YedK
MCGRIVRRSVDDYQDSFGVTEFREVRIIPRFNIAPTQRDLIIRAEAGGRRLVESRWG